MNAKLVAAALMLVALAGTAGAQTSQTQTVNFTVSAISQFSLTSTPVSLDVNAATPGNDPTPVTDATSRWAITTNVSNTKISASIPTDMPSGVTLNVLLAAPSNATSVARDLSSTSQDLVTGISKLKASNLGVTYTLSATAAAGTATGSRIVTYTLTPGT